MTCLQRGRNHLSKGDPEEGIGKFWKDIGRLYKKTGTHAKIEGGFSKKRQYILVTIFASDALTKTSVIRNILDIRVINISS